MKDSMTRNSRATRRTGEVTIAMHIVIWKIYCTTLSLLQKSHTLRVQVTKPNSKIPSAHISHPGATILAEIVIMPNIFHSSLSISEGKSKFHVDK